MTWWVEASKASPNSQLMLLTSCVLLQIRSCQFLLAAFSAAHALESSEMLDPWTTSPTKEVLDTKFPLGNLMKLPRIHCIKLFPWLERRLTSFEHAALWKMQSPSPTKTCCTIWSSSHPAFLWVAFLQFWLLMAGRTNSYETLRDMLWGIAWH